MLDIWDLAEGVVQCVGWVERSEPHQKSWGELVGLAAASTHPDMVGPVKGCVSFFCFALHGDASSERGEVLGGMVSDGGSA